MLIRVMYSDGHYHLVKATAVDTLINSGKIVKFYRSGHWVTIGCEPLRGMGGSGTGYRRRKSDHENAASLLTSVRRSALSRK